MSVKRVGVFGGSFNPVHNGHIRLAESVFNELGLDKIIFVPAGAAPHKSSAEYALGIHRFNMCALALENVGFAEVSDYEIGKPGKSYTYSTLEHFLKDDPQQKLYLLIGSDMLLSFDRWYRYKDIMRVSTLAVVSRTNRDAGELERKAEELRSFGDIYLSESEGMPMSSSLIRELIKNNKDFSCYLAENVVQYIKSNNLYGIE